MREKVLETFPTVSKITITSLGVVIGAHCGPGLFTIFYLGNKRYA
jgi:fatty acid-binding protein DegV